MTHADPSTLHRTAKYFMDNGRADTPEAALGLLQSFGLTVVVSPDIVRSQAAQLALLTLVNLGRRTLLAGVEVVGELNVPTLVPLALEPTLAAAVLSLGGRAASAPRREWPVAYIGEGAAGEAEAPSWRLVWGGWRAGVVPGRDRFTLEGGSRMPLAPVAAAAICMAEVFAYHAGDHAMAGKRAAGMSLWRPGRDWMADDSTEPALTFLPSRLWLIGLGNLGQAYAWLLACLPYSSSVSLEVMLQDFDFLAVSNDSTSILTNLSVVGQKKARWTAQWLESRGIGIEASIEERRFGEWSRRNFDEPGVALCGVDNAPARGALEDADFELIVESGLGAGPQSFRNFTIHTFPARRRAKEYWPKTFESHAPDVSSMPAYKKMKASGIDDCGVTQMASRTVGVPFVGLISGVLVISELLRRLHGGSAAEVISGSTHCLEDLEVVEGAARIYSHGFVGAAADS